MAYPSTCRRFEDASVLEIVLYPCLTGMPLNTVISGNPSQPNGVWRRSISTIRVIIFKTATYLSTPNLNVFRACRADLSWRWAWHTSYSIEITEFGAKISPEAVGLNLVILDREINYDRFHSLSFFFPRWGCPRSRANEEPTYTGGHQILPAPVP